MESKQLLLNMNPKDIPTPDSEDFDAFWENEKYKAEYGVTINGVFISPWLYWHTQLWNIFDDIEDPINFTIKRVGMKASFRDNEWIISEGIEEATKARKGVMFFGSRRLGKSEFISSYVAQGATLFQGTENVVMGGNWGDIDIIMAKVDYGLNKLPSYFKSPRLATNLRKEVELGYKDKKGERNSWSRIVARNHEEGNDTESPAGLTPTRFIMDEVGKSKFSAVFEAAKPSFTSKFGWRCAPMLTGTSGDLKPGSDAEKLFNNPDSHNFIVRELREEGNKKVSVFISGFYRMEGKVETTLGNFIQNEKGILLPEDSELFSVPTFVKDNDKAEAVIDLEREQAKQSPDPTALLKATMYYPKNTKELFLNDDGNIFPVEAINEHIDYLQQNPDQQGQAAHVYRDVDGRVRFSFNTTKKPILDYPLPANSPLSVKDGAIVIHEVPEPASLFYQYVAGADPYNSSQSVNSESLGSFYIYKRVLDPIDGTFQRRIVCSYTARPPEIKDFYATVEMLLELYNCIVLPENPAGNTFVQYFDLKNKAYMIADTYNFLKEISPNTSIKNQPKGLPPTPAVQKYYKQLIYDYLTEKLDYGFDIDGKRLVKLGVVRIPDIGLLRELAAYNDTGNFDRYVAFGHTLAHEMWADKIYPLIRKEVGVLSETKKSKSAPTISSPFSLGSSNPFGNHSNNPFGLGKK